MNKKIYFLVILFLGLLSFWKIGSFLTQTEKIETTSSVLITPSVSKFPSSPKNNYGEINLEILSTTPLKIGQNFEVKVTVNSPKTPIVGVDLILSFDPQVISFEKVIFNQNLFEQNIINTQKQKEGKIKITSYNPVVPVIKTSNLANLTFKLLKKQPTQIKVDFEKEDSLTDSNLISEEKNDILKKGFILTINQDEK